MIRFAAIIGKAILLIAIIVFSVWAALAIWYRAPVDEHLRAIAAAIAFLLGCIGAAFPFTKVPRSLLALNLVVAVVVVTWWHSISPPAIGNWSPDVARQTTGTLNGDILTLSNVRDFQWRSKSDFDARWLEQSYDLSKLSTADLFLSYWGGPAMAHFIVSFGFSDGEYLAWSVEVRREKNSGFSPVADFFKEHTLSIIAAKERDVVGVRTNVREEDVQLYRLRFDPRQARSLLLKYVEDANALSTEPRWYNSITTNCTTVVFHMMQVIGQGRPFDWRIVVNGYLPEYGYEHGTINNEMPLEELREKSKISEKGKSAGLTRDYSTKIRVDVPFPPPAK